MPICLLFGVKGFGQFSFGVSPGLSTNTAYFGMKMGKIVPYVGFQYGHLGVKVESSDHYYTGVEWVTDESKTKINGNLYIPEIGVKFFAIEKNKLKAYLNLNLTKPMIRAKMEVDDVEVEEIGDLLKEVKLFGGELGFGVEYFFDDNFSMGGEFGIRYLHGKYEDVNDYISSGEPAEETTTFKIGVMPTYSKISLNFYFGGKGE